jgi:hypothetical protein
VRATEVDGQGFEIAETIPAPAARDATVRAYPLIVRHRVAPSIAVGQWVTVGQLWAGGVLEPLDLAAGSN